MSIDNSTLFLSLSSFGLVPCHLPAAISQVNLGLIKKIKHLFILKQINLIYIYIYRQIQRTYIHTYTLHCYYKRGPVVHFHSNVSLIDLSLSLLLLSSSVSILTISICYWSGDGSADTANLGHHSVLSQRSFLFLGGTTSLVCSRTSLWIGPVFSNDEILVKIPAGVRVLREQPRQQA